MGRILKRIKRLVNNAVGTKKAVAVPYNISIQEPNRLFGQIALITGASGAIGRAIAVRLAVDGATVYIGGTNHERVQNVVNEILELGGTAYPCLMDTSQEVEMKRIFESIREKHQRLDIMVYSAGGSARGNSAPIHELETNVIDQTISINLRGAILCTREASKLMIDAKKGNIIHISSIIGERGKAKFSEYAAAKAGVIAFSKSVAMELGNYGIRVNCVSPGIVQRGEIDAEKLERIQKTNWLSGYGKPEDISEMVSFLVSKEASFITGQNLIVDGGRSLGLKGD